MHKSRIGSVLLALSLLCLGGCAINKATATVHSPTELAAAKRMYVVPVVEDTRGINQMIADRLNTMGFVASTGPAKPAGVDAVVTYVDRWMWDITMYMIDLTIVVRDAASDFPLATGNSMHTSLTRKSPTEMVEEVTNNIFKGTKK